VKAGVVATCTVQNLANCGHGISDSVALDESEVRRWGAKEDCSKSMISSSD
jgi:hypothetical protein